MAAALALQRSFVDKSHLQFYSGGGRAAGSKVAAAAPRVRRSLRLSATAAAATEGRRARVLQQVADVESTLHRLEQAGGLAVSRFALERSLSQHDAVQPPAPATSGTSSHSNTTSSDADAVASSSVGPEMERAWSTSSSSSAASSGSSTSSDSSDSESSSDSEGEAPATARRAAHRVAQRPQPQAETLQQRQQQASNILAAPLPHGVAVAPSHSPAAATVVRVCQGKKCASAGSAALLAQYASMPGVVAQPTKCLKQCKRCMVVEMANASTPGFASLYTNVTPATAAPVLAAHHQQQQRHTTMAAL